ncbi:arginase family protein [Candidatus Woesearchaeota archaeon]|nr:arginase family protein [Candidatus Woesearchaeota archaeon]
MKIIKAGFSGGGLGRGDGSNLAPDLVVKHLESVYSNEDQKRCVFEIEELVLDEKNIEESHALIEESVSKEDKAIIIGGDHSITYPAVKGFSKNNEDFILIIFDAHPDLMDDFKPPTQEDYLKVLVEEGVVKPENVILVGLRNWDAQEISYLEKKQIRFYTCKEIFEKGIKEITKEIIIKITKPVYLSVDVDVVDPTEAIGTGYLEHGGLSSRELIYALQKIKETNKIGMCDLVEINPEKDVNEMTSILGAKIVGELCDF